MTQERLRAKIECAKSDRKASLDFAHKEYEQVAKRINEKIEELKGITAYAMADRNKKIEEAKAICADRIRRATEQYQRERDKEKAAGVVSRANFNEAVALIERFLRQDNQQGITIAWGKERKCQIQFSERNGEACDCSDPE